MTYEADGRPAPRIAPGSRRQIGVANWLIATVLGWASGTTRPHLFTTLARHRRIYHRWLWFAAALMPGGRMPRIDSELVILRVAANCDCEYERGHHERLGRRAGLSAEQVQQVAAGPSAGCFSPHQRLLLRCADELHEQRDISQELWEDLSLQLSDVQLIELCLLVGHYEMLAMTINALRIQPDQPG